MVDVGQAVVVLGDGSAHTGGSRPDGGPGGDRSRVLVLDDGAALTDRQGLAAAVERAFDGEPVDLVVDEGSHPPEHSRAAFDALYPRLRPGGRYVVSSWNADQQLLDDLAQTLRDPSAPGHDEAVAVMADGMRQGTPGVDGRPSLLRLTMELVMAQASGTAIIESMVLGDTDVTVVRGSAPLDPVTFRLVDSFTDHLGVLGRPGQAGDRWGSWPPRPRVATSPTDRFSSRCSVCGRSGWFERGEKPTRESFRCRACRASVRYQAQAVVLLELFGDTRATSLKALAKHPEFRRLAIYEPGKLGPFRPILRRLKGYSRSTFTPGVALGAEVRGIPNQNLESLTYPDGSFDLVLTSDVLEHVRHPDRVWRRPSASCGRVEPTSSASPACGRCQRSRCHGSSRGRRGHPHPRAPPPQRPPRLQRLRCGPARPSARRRVRGIVGQVRVPGPGRLRTCTFVRARRPDR